MTVMSQGTKVVYEANGVARNWEIAFAVLDAEDVEIYVTSPEGVTEPVESNYSVGGGKVLYPVVGDPLPTGWKVTLLRAMPVVQPLDLVHQGPWNPEEVERALDRIVMQTQQLAEAVSRAVKLGVADTDIDADGVLDFLRNSESRLDAVAADLAGIRNELAEARDTALGEIGEARDTAVTTVEASRDQAVSDVGALRGVALAEMTLLRTTTISDVNLLKEAAEASEAAASLSAERAAVSETAASLSAERAAASEVAAASAEDAAEEYAVAAAASAAAAYGASAPPWNPAETYVYPQAVAYLDGHTYRCTGTSVPGVSPGEDEANWTRITAVSEGFFELDADGESLMPNLVPGYSNEWTVDEDLDIMPRL